MKKPRKKRKMKSYAMGSGNTGVIKNYMPNPNEVFRQDKINADKAISTGASNPFVIGMDILGSMATQMGMGILSQGVSQGKGATPPPTGTAVTGAMVDIAKNKNIDINTGKPMGKSVIQKDRSGAPWTESFAMGTDPLGTGAKVNAEKGEVIETPEGEMTELNGKKHKDGGVDIEVPEGTLIFSDQLVIDGKTPAERKKARENKLSLLLKKVDKDPTDLITKETYKRTKQNFDFEEQSDLMVQGFAKQLDDVTAAMGTDPAGTYANGTGPDGVDEEGTFGDQLGQFFGGFTGGDLIGMAGNVYSGLAPLLSAKKNAADNTVNENLFEGFGDEALDTIDQAGSMIQGQQDQAGKAIEVSKNKALTSGRNKARGINQMRAGDLAVNVNANKAMNEMYGDFTKMMMENLYKKSGLQAKVGETEAKGATAADIANRMDADNAATQIGVAQETLGRGIQTIGKDLNANKKNRMLVNLANNLSKHGLKFDNQGNIIEG